MAHEASVPNAEFTIPRAPERSLDGRLALLEARLSLLERRVRRSTERPVSHEACNGGDIAYAVDQPGLIICDAYEIERDERDRTFCWVGGTDRIQFVFPHAPRPGQICRMRLLPHPSVDFRRLQVVVNDEKQTHLLASETDELMELRFAIENIDCPNINILLLNLGGVCPAKIGERDDSRLLTARFYGAVFSEF